MLCPCHIALSFFFLSQSRLERSLITSKQAAKKQMVFSFLVIQCDVPASCHEILQKKTRWAIAATTAFNPLSLWQSRRKEEFHLHMAGHCLSKIFDHMDSWFLIGFEFHITSTTSSVCAVAVYDLHLTPHLSLLSDSQTWSRWLLLILAHLLDRVLHEVDTGVTNPPVQLGFLQMPRNKNANTIHKRSFQPKPKKWDDDDDQQQHHYYYYHNPTQDNECLKDCATVDKSVSTCMHVEWICFCFSFHRIIEKGNEWICYTPPFSCWCWRKSDDGIMAGKITRTKNTTNISVKYFEDGIFR